ncbi:hypothetical protein M9H77_08458 [Catharanthus roseus]|uniref:Uncharacterized protein n=1 Tax=Catharanthus roseus TaxID=4058 RepID=A0ACC0BY48_CATRO|nr:hypothetical protein M9H77_08458 [Catharanthus roseus]
MSVPKIETDRFDGKSDFVMWRRKMKAVLVQNKIAPAICSPEEYPESWKDLDLQKQDKSHGENVFVRGRIDRRETPSRHFKSRSKSREKSKVKSQFSLFIDPVMLWASTEIDRLLVLYLGCHLGRLSYSHLAVASRPPLERVFREIPAAWAGHPSRLLVTPATIRLAPS